MRRRAVLLLTVMTMALVAVASPAWAADPFIVNSTDDDPAAGRTTNGVCATATAGECTLRAAIEEANGTTGADTINFAIPGNGPHTIAPASQLDPITEAVTIDGYTETGAIVNSAATNANDAVLKIELSGVSAGASAKGLRITGSGAGGTTIKGLVINRFSGDGVVISGSDTTNIKIEGNFIGTDVTGTSTTNLGNLQGVNIIGATGNFVGGTAAAASNVISGNTVRGVIIAGDSTDNKVQGNFIGTNAAGTAALGNGDAGVDINDGSDNLVGGTVAGERNLISGNDTDGVEINLGSNNNRVEGNFIGTSVTGTQDLGNGEVGVLIRGPGNIVGGPGFATRNVISGNSGVGVSMLGISASNNTVQGNLIGPDVNGEDLGGQGNFHGVFISGASNNLVGGTDPAAANTISHNDNHGVIIVGATATGNSVLRNSIFNNGQLGIELNNDGVTFNDKKDPDTGPNLLQNFPVITSASPTTVKGTLNSRPRKFFTIQFFSNPAGTDEGKKFIGQTTVKTNRKGSRSFTFTPTQAVSAGDAITATATNEATGDTSEFSTAMPVS